MAAFCYIAIMHHIKIIRVEPRGKSRFRRTHHGEYYWEVIQEFVLDGWELMQIVTPPVGGSYGGSAVYYDLVFQKAADEYETPKVSMQHWKDIENERVE